MDKDLLPFIHTFWYSYLQSHPSDCSSSTFLCIFFGQPISISCSRWGCSDYIAFAIDVCHVHKLAVTTSSGETNLNVLQDGIIPILAFSGEEIDVAHDMGTYSWKHQSMLSLLVSLMRKYKNDNEHNFLGESNCSFSLLIEMLLKRIAVLDSDCRNKLLSLAPDVITRVKELVLDKLPQKVYNSDE